MVLTIKAAAPAGYYFQANGLEARSDFAEGQWRGGSDRLGIKKSQKVEKDIFERLLNRQSAFGEAPTFNRATAGTGRDFVFSAPKSVSIVWALSSVKIKALIENAQFLAVEAAVELLFEEACRERCGKGGGTLARAKGAAAIFNHVATRTAQHAGREEDPDENLLFPDPNLHTHVVVPDIIEGTKGRLKIGYTALHGYWSMALGAWYHATLAYHLKAAGFHVKAVGNNGLFQLTEFPSPWITLFSARTTGTRAFAHILASGASASREATEAFERTRAKSRPIDAKALDVRWKSYAKAHEVDVTRFFPSTEALTFAPLTDELNAELCRQAVEDASACDAVLQKQDICRAFASRIVDNGLHLAPKIKMVIPILENSELLEALMPSRAYGFSQWTTKANSEDERVVIDVAQKLNGLSFCAPDVSIAEHAALSYFNEDQRRIAGVAMSSARLSIINGAPGTGKTTLLGPVVSAFEAMNGSGSVIGAAEAWQPALALKRAFNIPAYSLEQLFPRQGASRIKVGPKSVLIIDEAGLLPTRRMRALLELARDSGAKLILVGDEGQLNPIGAGSGMRLVQSILAAQSLTKIVRQEGGIHRSVTEALVALRRPTPQPEVKAKQPEEFSDTSDLIKSYDAVSVQAADEIARKMLESRRWQSFANADSAVARIVDTLVESIVGADVRSVRHLALARSNREVHHVTRRLRVRLKTLGIISGEDIVVPCVTPMGVPLRLSLAVGDRIRFLVKNNGLQVFNGDCATITRIDKVPNDLRLSVTIDDLACPRSASFLVSEFKDKAGRARIAPGYVGTIYGCQGLTVDQVTVLKSGAMTFRELYVAATRARNECRIIEVNAKRAATGALDIKDRSNEAALALELLGMARRDRAKANALDHRSTARTEIDLGSNWLWSSIFDGQLEDFRTLKEEKALTLRSRNARFVVNSAISST